MNTKTFKIETLRQKLFWLLLVFLLITLVSYIYLINNIFFTAADREALLNRRDQLTLDMSILEEQSLTLAKTITIDRAYSLGFEEAGVNNAAFATLSLPHFAKR